MGDYKIKINIGIYDGSSLSNGVVVATEGDISESDAESIDAVEKALLRVNKEALVESISKHLGEISKKKAQNEQELIGGNIVENEKLYCVDGEIGRFAFKTHKIVDNCRKLFDTSKDIFRTLYVKEWYRTQGFNEIAFAFVVDESYRKADKKLNRIRREGNGGTPMRTLSNAVEIEGDRINEFVKEKVSSILEESEFTKRLCRVMLLLNMG